MSLEGGDLLKSVKVNRFVQARQDSLCGVGLCLLQSKPILLHSLVQGQEAKSDTQLRVRTCFSVKFPNVSLCSVQFSLSQPFEGKGRGGTAGWLGWCSLVL